MQTKTIVEVRKNANENNLSLLRRFSRRVQESGNIPKLKSTRYNERPLSKLKTKHATLKRLSRRKNYELLVKMGKARVGKR